MLETGATIKRRELTVDLCRGEWVSGWARFGITSTGIPIGPLESRFIVARRLANFVINAAASQCRNPRTTRIAWDNATRKTGCCIREILSIRGALEEQSRIRFAYISDLELLFHCFSFPLVSLLSQRNGRHFSLD